LWRAAEKTSLSRVTCVALEDRVMSALRAVPLGDTLNIIRRVDELPGAA